MTQQIPTELDQHAGHNIGVDYFATEVAGVARTDGGNAWCFDCDCPVAAKIVKEDEDGKRHS